VILLCASDGATLRGVKTGPVPIDERWLRPAVMGVVNVTPDSFSDGGLFLKPADAIEHGRRLFADGASLVDVGGESTRPGAAPISVDDELRRVLPVVEGLAGVPLSIDTSKAVVARSVLDAGAEMVNDVTALRGDPSLAAVVAEHDAYVCLMHMQGEPRTMQVAPLYDDVVSEVLAFLESRVAFAVHAGIAEERICIDPGIGFGKTPDQNLELLRRLGELLALGRPVLVGVSRKSTLGKVLGDPGAATGSTSASVGGAVAAFERGAWMLRAHDVRETVEALAVAAAVKRGRVIA
jgi:dihydropteroate synthase